MCNTQKNSLLLNQHNGDDAPQNSKNASNVSVATRCITQLERVFFLKKLRTKQFPPFLTFLILWTIGRASNDEPPVKIKNILRNSVSHGRGDEHLILLGNNPVYIGK